MRHLNWLLGPLLIFTLIQCSTPDRSLGQGVRHDSAMNDSPGIDNPANRSLADLLRRVPGIEIKGNGDYTEVNVRGIISPQGDNRPLYVIDGTPVGRSYNDVASLIVVENVANIRVKKGAQAGLYGARGANGVIEITTREE